MPIPNWFRTVLAPLFVISLGLHSLLLLAPVPSRPEGESQPEAEPVEESGPVDLLSISSLASPEPELPLTPPPEVAPPPIPAAAPVAPQAPTQPIIPEVYPDPDLTRPEPSLTESPPLAEPSFAETPEPAPTDFVQEEEVVEIFTRLTRGDGSDFDSTETSFPAIAYLTRHGISEWSAREQDCFFTQINADDYRLHPKVASLRYLTRNVQFIENQDIPNTFPAPTYQVNNLPEGYCNRPLFQVLREGQPFLFVSVAGIGVGAVGQQASGLVIIWSSDPRQG